MEQVIVFLYDTEYCKHEADDPQEAVIFFHPAWVSDQQKLALCGQLMGVTHFCSSFFSAPSVLTLQSGKFVLKKFGRYVLSVGSDQCLSEWILKERFRILQSSLELYYKNLDSIRDSVGDEHAAFVKKITHFLESSVPILQTVVSSVGSVPSLTYAKGSSSVFLESMQLLEACSVNEGVAGGIVLHNGRIVASQLDSETNKLFSYTESCRNSGSAESIQVPFHLPVGVQLFNVFVEGKLLDVLKQKPAKFRRTVENSKQIGTREIKKIFTLHEDETWLGHTIDVVPNNEPVTPKFKQRRNSKHKTESNALKERSRNFKANPNITICSTPTVEKKLIHDEILSICSGKVDSMGTNGGAVPDLVQDVINAKPNDSVTPYKSFKRVIMDDQMVDLNHKAYPIPLRYYSFGLPKIYKSETEQPKTLYKNKWYKTIPDPLFPILREDGIPVSKGLYNHRLDEHYKDFLTANLTIDSQEEFLRSRNIKNSVEKVAPKKVEEKPTEFEKLPEKKMDQKLFRRSLTLPLKPVVLDVETTHVTSKKKALPPITPTTPLMSKLSLLMIEEQELRDKKSTEPMIVPSRILEEKKEERKVRSETAKESSEIVPCSLFVCNHRNMTLLLLLNRGVEQNPDLVLRLWEAATSNLDQIELLWERSMDHVTQPNGSASYSFLSLDPDWGTVKKYGPWGNDELRVVGSLHQDLLQSANITELIIRNEDFVVYGYRCGGMETYYQQGGCSSVGLPTPADLMGVVTLKARRRLERDHGVVIL